MIRESEKIKSIATTIKRYLLQRPNATETVEGVARWWLLQQRYEDSLEQVKLALELLEQEGTVRKIQLSDGREAYRNATNVTHH